MLARSYRLQAADREDVIAESLLECLKTGGLIQKNVDGFFFVVARRRASDLCRRKMREEALPGDGLSSEAHTEQGAIMLLQEVAGRFFATRPRLARCRARSVLRDLVDGAGFAEACRSAGIPRGSQGRYRFLLQQCFREVLHPT